MQRNIHISALHPFLALDLERRGYLATATATRCVWQALNHVCDPKVEAAVTLAESYVCGNTFDSRDALIMRDALDDRMAGLDSMVDLASFAAYALILAVLEEEEGSESGAAASAVSAITAALSVSILATVKMVEPLDLQDEKRAIRAVLRKSRFVGSALADYELANLSPAAYASVASAWSRLWGELECSVRVLSTSHSISHSPSKPGGQQLWNLSTWVRAAAARDALTYSDPETVDYFLREVLGVRSGSDWSWEEMQQALWLVLNRGQRWLQIEPTELRQWLRSAVVKQARRLRRDLELKDRVWFRRAKPQSPSLTSLEDFMIPSTEDPLQTLLRKEENRTMLQVLGELLCSGTPRDQQFARFFIAGYEPVDAVKALGVKWSAWEAFRNKARRRKNAMDNRLSVDV